MLPIHWTSMLSGKSHHLIFASIIFVILSVTNAFVVNRVQSQSVQNGPIRTSRNRTVGCKEGGKSQSKTAPLRYSDL